MTRDDLAEWAARWHVAPAAVADLLAAMTGPDVIPRVGAAPGTSEAAVQAVTRLRMSQLGGRAWRNNVGALLDSRGVPVRYGLANDSAAVNARIKSADLIGINPVAIGPEHVGTVMGQFWSRECKAANWRYTGDGHEVAQLAWIQLIVSLGGDAAFATY